MNLQAFFRMSLAAVLLAVLPAWAEQGTIRGTVTDGEDATPLPSANLNLVGTMRGTMTSDDGTFSPRGPARLLYATSDLHRLPSRQAERRSSSRGDGDC